MLSSLIKFPLYFGLSFFILSIPINHKSVFYYLDEITSEYVRPIQVQISGNIKDGIKLLKTASKKVFTTRLPKNKDLIRSKMSAQKHRTFDSSLSVETIDDEGLETYSQDEVEELRKITAQDK